MIEKPNGGPAFPGIERSNIGAAGISNSSFSYYHGMSLRDYFAGQAIIGLLNGQWPIEVKDTATQDTIARVAAETAYQFADAMIKARRQ